MHLCDQKNITYHSNMLICCSINMFLLLSMLKTVVLNIFGNSNIFFQDSLMNKVEKDSKLLEIEIFCNVINVFTDTSD